LNALHEAMFRAHAARMAGKEDAAEEELVEAQVRFMATARSTKAHLVDMDDLAYNTPRYRPTRARCGRRSDSWVEVPASRVESGEVRICTQCLRAAEVIMIWRSNGTAMADSKSS
jgi:hypothetical protein